MGKCCPYSELKPGMAGTASITTRTTVTPVTVTEVKNGTVFQASGGSIIVKTDEGFKSFTQGDIDKRAIKIMKDGQPAQISDFHANDRLTATIITSKPPHVLTQKEVTATLAKSEAPAGAAPAAAPRASAPPSGAAAAAPPAKPTGTTSTPAPNPTPAAGAGAAPKKLPKTASALPELGLIRHYVARCGARPRPHQASLTALAVRCPRRPRLVRSSAACWRGVLDLGRPST